MTFEIEQRPEGVIHVRARYTKPDDTGLGGSWETSTIAAILTPVKISGYWGGDILLDVDGWAVSGFTGKLVYTWLPGPKGVAELIEIVQGQFAKRVAGK